MTRRFFSKICIQFLLFLGLHQTKIFAAINDFIKTDEEWRKILSPEQFRILRKEGTEPAFTSSLNDEKRKEIMYAWVVIQNYSIHLKNMIQARVGPLFMIMFQGRLEPKQITNLFSQEQSIIALIAKDITDMFLMMDQLQPLNDIVITE
jgi:hypothetical protein